MPKPIRLTLAALALSFFMLGGPSAHPAAAAGGIPEYAMIRFDGLRYSHVVWPDGSVQFVESLLPDIMSRPEHTDERIYVLTRLINKLGQQGYDYVTMISFDQVLMKRAR